MKRIIATLVFGILMLATLSPLVSYADTSGLIPCGFDVNNDGVVADQMNPDGSIKVSEECHYSDFIILIQTVIDFLIFKLAAPISAIMFAYAGFLYMTNNGNESQIKQAHDIFLYVFWGFVIALGAWLVVKVILGFLIGDASPFNFLK